MVVEEAVKEHDKKRRRRVVLLEDDTRRISPTLDLAREVCPLLYVDSAFRAIALKTYHKAQVIEHGPPTAGQYGSEGDWYNGQREFQYSVDIARQIDEEARQAAENGNLKVRLKLCSYFTIIPVS